MNRNTATLRAKIINGISIIEYSNEERVVFSYSFRALRHLVYDLLLLRLISFLSLLSLLPDLSLESSLSLDMDLYEGLLRFLTGDLRNMAELKGCNSKV